MTTSETVGISLTRSRESTRGALFAPGVIVPRSSLHGPARYRVATLLGLLAFLLTACASRPYQGVAVESAGFLDRSVSQQEGHLMVTTAVPDADETKALTGLDLYAQGIQPVWLKIENRGTSPARMTTWSVDRNYFSPIEVAYMNRKQFSGEGYRDMERWFYQNSMPRRIPAGETRSGLVFTNLRPGTKGFNLNVFSDGTAYDFTFFVPLPGFVADFMNVDFDTLYSESEIRQLNPQQLKVVLEGELGCCATDPSGELEGGAFNIVLVGTGRAVRRSMLRGDWLETSGAKGVADRARKQHFRGRPPDAIFRKYRQDGNETIQLQLWMAPWRVESEPVWVAQVYYWTKADSALGDLIAQRSENESALRSFFVRESVTADIDSAQRFLFQNLWYNGSLRKAGYVSGAGRSTLESPRTSFGGAVYFTDGFRAVVFLSEEPRALDEGEVIYGVQRRRPAQEAGP